MTHVLLDLTSLDYYTEASVLEQHLVVAASGGDTTTLYTVVYTYTALYTFI